MSEPKFKCSECPWQGVDSELLRAPNPFADSDDNELMIGCPQCREPNTMRGACDELGCWQEATMGTPIPDGYRRTCFTHRQNHPSPDSTRKP